MRLEGEGGRLFLCHVFHKVVKEEGVSVGLKHSGSLTECVFQKRVECVPVKKN